MSTFPLALLRRRSYSSLTSCLANQAQGRRDASPEDHVPRPHRQYNLPAMHSMHRARAATGRHNVLLKRWSHDRAARGIQPVTYCLCWRPVVDWRGRHSAGAHRAVSQRQQRRRCLFHHDLLTAHLDPGMETVPMMISTPVEDFGMAPQAVVDAGATSIDGVIKDRPAVLADQKLQYNDAVIWTIRIALIISCLSALTSNSCGVEERQREENCNGSCLVSLKAVRIYPSRLLNFKSFYCGWDAEPRPLYQEVQRAVLHISQYIATQGHS